MFELQKIPYAMNTKFRAMAKDLLIDSILEVGRFSPLTNISRSAAEHTIQYVGKGEKKSS